MVVPVAPVQVFRHQQQRTLLGVAVEQLAHLAQHAVRAHAGQLTPQRVAFLRGAEPRQLQQPGRRHVAQQRRQRAVAAAQLGQRFQHRQVRLAGAVVLHALPARAGDAAEAGYEVLDQRGLADARFAGDPDHRALPAAGLVPRLLQPGDRVRAADERRRRLRARRRRGGERRCRRRGGRHRDEAVAAPRYGFDETRLAGVVCERYAQVADGGLQHRVADELVAPHRVEQRVLRQQRARLARQRAQQVEGSGRERDSLPIAQQAGIRLVEFKLVEADPNRIRDGLRTCHALRRAMLTRSNYRAAGDASPVAAAAPARLSGRSGPCSAAGRTGSMVTV